MSVSIVGVMGIFVARMYIFKGRDAGMDNLMPQVIEKVDR
jgi:hypothetical protein